ncbi:uncharacterized protein BT62DRAFT_739027 [Guyanagaster necrorhizus]|uniref:Uncharacterized protein n=1 Tax=Guyanagaster necrorhizus TaxID=856835 RepID=A0A9P7VF27_9AGAR|nr:uncharacterized protein BT62DRAFT_739027 [Guyanagaster necrorhizus MCA 3950]KAG7439388.1 hypothetical protein BT62DRAFT_739027 [Guyanagaster necrorhizus MCA 3950]
MLTKLTNHNGHCATTPGRCLASWFPRTIIIYLCNVYVAAVDFLLWLLNVTARAANDWRNEWLSRYECLVSQGPTLQCCGESD